MGTVQRWEEKESERKLHLLSHTDTGAFQCLLTCRCLSYNIMQGSDAVFIYHKFW